MLTVSDTSVCFWSTHWLRCVWWTQTSARVSAALLVVFTQSQKQSEIRYSLVDNKANKDTKHRFCLFRMQWQSLGWKKRRGKLGYKRRKKKKSAPNRRQTEVTVLISRNSQSKCKIQVFLFYFIFFKSVIKSWPTASHQQWPREQASTETCIQQLAVQVLLAHYSTELSKSCLQ